MWESSLPVGVEEGFLPSLEDRGDVEHLPADHHLPLAHQLARVLPELCIRKQGKDLPGGKLLQGDFLRLVRSQHPGIPQGFPILLFLLHPLASFSP